MCFFFQFGLAQDGEHPDCIDPYPVCGTASIKFDVTNTGDILETFPLPAGCDLKQNATQWIKFKIFSSGTISFDIAPVNQNEDYDFGVFGPNYDCDNFNAPLRSNFSATTGNTGLNFSETQTCSSGAAVSAYSRGFDALAGEEYVILVDNWSAQSGPVSGFTLRWTGTANLDCSIVAGNLGPDQDLCEGESTILDGTTDGATSYAWHIDSTPDNGEDNFVLIAGETNPTLTINNDLTGIYRVIVSDGVATDQDDVIIRFHVIPTATKPDDMLQCDDDNDDTWSFDLTAQDATILNGQSSTDFSVSYHTSATNAVDGVVDIPDPSAFVNTANPQTIFARVENNANTNCFDTTSFFIQVFDSPTATKPDDMLQCDDDNDDAWSFDLTAQDATILNGQSSTDFSVSYHTSATNAVDGVVDIPDPSAFVNTSNPQTIFVRVENNANTNCFDTTSFFIQVFDSPTATKPDDMLQCDDDNDDAWSFDLTAQDATILNGQSSTDFSVSYHTSATNAVDGVVDIPDPSAFINTTNPQTIFARVENNANTNCFETTSFFIQVFDSPTATKPDDMLQCDDDNDDTWSFDLTAQDATILNGQSSTDFSVSYHTSATNAVDGVVDIPDPSAFVNTANPQTIFARVENNANTNCFETTSFFIQVFDSPTATKPDDMLQCDDDNDDAWSFDLTAQDATILNGQSSTDFSVSYHTSATNAVDGVVDIPDPSAFINTTNPQTIFVRVGNNANTNCFETTSFFIQVFDSPDAINVLLPIVTCSPVTTADFDLIAEANPLVTGGNATWNVSYFEDVDLTNPILNPTNYNAGSKRIFALVEDPTNNLCSDTATVDLEVLLEPQANPQSISLCSSTNQATFDLTGVENDIINNQIGVTVPSYHLTMGDANNDENPILNPTTFVSSSTVVFARSLGTYQNGMCHNVSPITLTVNPNPEANAIVYPECSTSATQTFDLTSQKDLITGGESPRVVSFHEIQDDALNNINKIITPETYVSDNKIIFVRVENTDTGCDSVTTLELQVVAQPEVNEDLSMTECFVNGVATFLLEEYELLLQQTYPSYMFQFYETEQHAIDNTSEFPDNYQSEEKTIWSRVSVIGNSQCFITKQVELFITPTPFDDLDSEIICPGDGYELFANAGISTGEIVDAAGVYTRTIIDETTGCDHTYQIELILADILFPTAFTPNANGKNDTFGPLPPAKCTAFVSDFYFVIFNRWGEKVFETNDYDDAWNGQFKGQASLVGTYVWYASYKFQGQDIEQKGAVHKLR